MALTIDNLQIQIETKASKAKTGIDELKTSLANLRDSIGNISGLVNTLTQLSTAMKGLSSAKSLAKGLTELDTAASVLKTDRLTEFSSQMKIIADGLSQLNTIEKGNLGSVLNQIKKIPEIAKELDPKTVTDFSTAIGKLVEALAPLASQMEVVSRGFGAMPSRMKSTIRASQQVVNSNKTMNKSYNSLGTQLARTMAKFWTLFYSMQRIVNIFADAFNSSNEYIESLNLFRVSMGDAGDTAMEFAEKVSALMGIDIAEWITNQGSFMRMSTGFGIATDKAEVMSKNLTQLAYDMSSFFNVDVQTAMDKLQSGMSGQIKGLKEWGYNLSVASLQETALRLGIEQSVRTMTEAQKAQLRYITLIERSNGVMGDMAKTINTPANALRVLKAHLERLERAFGNIVSVLVTKYIPYIMAFVELMEEGAKALADMWGFEIPDLPENNLEMGAEVIEGIGDESDETADKVAELKRQLMGFDELNILKTDKEDTQLPSYDLGIDLPEYNFLSGLSTQYRKEIDEIKEKFKDLIKVLEKLEPLIKGLAILFAFEWVVNTVSKLTALKGAFTLTSSVLGVLTKAGNQVWQTFLVTGDAVEALRLGTTSLGKTFKGFMENLSPLTKAITTVIALGAEFLVVKDAVYELTKGNKTLGESLMSIIPITAAVGTALYTMLGPWGLVAAAIAGVTGAIVGYMQAQEEAIAELMSTTVSQTFYDGMGTDIDLIAQSFVDWTTAITDSKKALIDMGNEIPDPETTIKPTADAITNLATQVTLGFKTIEETVPKIKTEFETLYNDTYSILNKQAELIYYALAGTTGKALEDMGFDLEKYGNAIQETVSGAIEGLENLYGEAEELMDAMHRDQAEFEEMGGMDALLNVMGEISRLSGLQVNPLEDFYNSLEGINWKSSDEVMNAFDQIAASAEEARQAVELSFDEDLKTLENMKSLTTDPTVIKTFEEMIQGFTTVKESELAEINEARQKLLNAMQADWVWNIEEQIAAAEKDWENVGFVERLLFYSNDRSLYVREALQKYKDEIIQPFCDGMVELFGKESAWAESAIQEVIDKMFTLQRTGMSDASIMHPLNSIIGSLESMPDDLKTSGANAVAGLVSGLSTTEDVINAAKDLAQKGVLDPFNGRMKINSPSKVMEEDGLYINQGLANGINNNAYIVINAWGALFEALEQRMSRFTANCQTTITELTKSFSNVYQPSGSIITDVDASLVGNISNKSAVTADGNLVNGIASAVYNAILSANEDTSNSGGESKIVVAIDGDKVGETSVRYINGKFVQTGVSPICY